MKKLLDIGMKIRLGTPSSPRIGRVQILLKTKEYHFEREGIVVAGMVAEITNFFGAISAKIVSQRCGRRVRRVWEKKRSPRLRIPELSGTNTRKEKRLKPKTQADIVPKKKCKNHRRAGGGKKDMHQKFAVFKRRDSLDAGEDKRSMREHLGVIGTN